MRSRFVLSTIAAFAVAAASLTAPTAVHAGAYPGNKCVTAKLKAASSSCKSVLAAWSKYVGGGGTDTVTRDAALAKAAGKLTTAYGKADTSATKASVDCATMTLTDAGTQAAIDAATASIVADVTTGLTLSNAADAKCGAGLLKAAADKCGAIIKDEAAYVSKQTLAGRTKRDAADDKAEIKFAASVTKAMNGGTCPTAATQVSIEDAVDDLTEDVITNHIISPNVSDTAFDTISPTEFPGIPYEGTVLNPTCSRQDSPYHFFVKRGTVNKLVMYYQGGGACWNAATCNLIGTFDQEVNPSGSDNPNNTSTGFGDLTNPDNPFKDWNIVFVSYCTGDIHFGDSESTFFPKVYWRGWQNARVAEKFAREHFVAPEEIFVTGSSAGAYGALFNAPLHERVWTDSKFSVLGDAGNGVITPAFLTDNFPIWNFAAHLPTDIPGVVESIINGTGLAAYTQAVAAFFPNTAWGHYTSSYDGGTGGQTGFYNVMLNINDVFAWPNWWNASCAWNSGMVAQATATAAAAPANYRYYIGTGSRHTMYGSNKVYDDQTGNMPSTIRDWIVSMLARDGGWTNQQCDTPTACGTLLAGDPRPSPLAAPFTQVGPDVVVQCP